VTPITAASRIFRIIRARIAPLYACSPAIRVRAPDVVDLEVEENVSTTPRISRSI
jgi:hypothetical protein